MVLSARIVSQPTSVAIPTVIPVVASVALLRTTPGAVGGPLPPSAVVPGARGGLFVWRGSSAPDDDGTRFNNGGGSSAGWERVFSGAVNVEWFGAVGDNSTPNAVAFQNAIDAAATLGCGVFVPAGRYIIEDTLYFHSGVSIAGETIGIAGGIAGGDSPNSILIHSFDGDMMVWDGSVGGNPASGGGAERLRIVQAFTTGSGTPRGTAIKVVATDFTHRPAWCTFWRVLIEETGGDPWTWGFEVDGGVKSYEHTGTGTASDTIDGTTTRIAQKFVLTASAAISSVLATLATNVGLTCTVRIETDNAGSPSGTLADAALEHTGFAFVGTDSNRITFVPEAVLLAGTYWLVFTRTAGSGTFNGSNTGTADQVKTYNGAWSVPAGGPDNLTGQISGIFGGIQDLFIGECSTHCSPALGLGGSVRLNGCAGLRMYNSHFSLDPGGIAVIGDTDASNSVQFENCSFSAGVDMQFGADFTIIGGIYGDISTSADTLGTVLLLPGRHAGTLTSASGSAVGRMVYDATSYAALAGGFHFSQGILLPNEIAYCAIDDGGVPRALLKADDDGRMRINPLGAFSEVRFGGVGVPCAVGITTGPLKFYGVGRVDADGIDLALGTSDASSVTIGKTANTLNVNGTPLMQNNKFIACLKAGGGNVAALGLDVNDAVRISPNGDAIVAVGAPNVSTNAAAGDLLLHKSNKLRFANNANNDTLAAVSKDASDFVNIGNDAASAGAKLYAGTTLRLNVDSTGIGVFNHAAAAQQNITGALSTVADAPAKAVLTSIIAALVAYGWATDGTT